MFANSNILPQVSQLTFAPQQSAMPNQDAFAVQEAGQKILDAPLNREIKRIQIESVQQQMALSRRAADQRDVEFEFRKQQHDEQQRDLFDRKIENSAKIYNDLTGLQFSNPGAAKAVQGVLDELGINENTLLGVLESTNNVALKQESDKLRQALYHPDVQKAMQLEAGFSSVMKAYQADPKKFDVQKLNYLVDTFETGEKIEDFSMKDFSINKYMKQEDPRELFYAKHTDIANRPGAYKDSGVQTAFYEGMSALGATEAEREMAWKDIYEFNVEDDVFRNIIEDYFYGMDLSNSELTELTERTKATANRIFETSGKAEAIKFVKEQEAAALKARTKNMELAYKNDQETRKQIEIENVKNIASAANKNKEEREKAAKKAAENRSAITGAGKVNPASPNARLTSPTVSSFIERKTSSEAAGSDTDDLTKVSIDNTGITIGGERKHWAAMSPTEAYASISNIVGNDNIFDFSKQSEFGGIDRETYILQEMLSLDNTIPISIEMAEIGYNPYNRETVRHTDNDGNRVEMPIDPNHLYYTDPKTGLLVTTDPRIYAQERQDAIRAGRRPSPQWDIKTIDIAGQKVDLFSHRQAQSLSISPQYSEAANMVIAVESENARFYNAYNFGGTNTTVGGSNPLNLNPTQMTIGDLISLQSRWDGGAVGAYQMRGGTLKEGAERLGYPNSAKFSEEVQNDIFHNYIIMNKRPDVYNFIRNMPGAKLEDAISAIEKEFVGLKDGGKAKDFLLAYKEAYQAEVARAEEILTAEPLPKDKNGVIGITGSTGNSTGPHLDIRLTNPASKTRSNPSMYEDYILVDGKPVSSFSKTQGWKTGKHEAIDRGTPMGREITLTKPLQDIVVSVETRVDSKGVAQPESGTSGGIYTVLTLNDGNELWLMHLDPATVPGTAVVSPPPEVDTQRSTSSSPPLNSAIESAVAIWSDALGNNSSSTASTPSANQSPPPTTPEEKVGTNQPTNQLEQLNITTPPTLGNVQPPLEGSNTSKQTPPAVNTEDVNRSGVNPLVDKSTPINRSEIEPLVKDLKNNKAITPVNVQELLGNVSRSEYERLTNYTSYSDIAGQNRVIAQQLEESLGVPQSEADELARKIRLSPYTGMSLYEDEVGSIAGVTKKKLSSPPTVAGQKDGAIVFIDAGDSDFYMIDESRNILIGPESGVFKDEDGYWVSNTKLVYSRDGEPEEVITPSQIVKRPNEATPSKISGVGKSSDGKSTFEKIAFNSEKREIGGRDVYDIKGTYKFNTKKVSKNTSSIISGAPSSESFMDEYNRVLNTYVPENQGGSGHRESSIEALNEYARAYSVAAELISTKNKGQIKQLLEDTNMFDPFPFIRAQLERYISPVAKHGIPYSEDILNLVSGYGITKDFLDNYNKQYLPVRK